MKFNKKAGIAAVLFVIMMVFAGCSSDTEGIQLILKKTLIK